MSGRDLMANKAGAVIEEQADGDLLRPLVLAPRIKQSHAPFPGGVLIGELIALKDEGRTPLVLFPGQPETAAVAARSVVDLHGLHIGRSVVLMFESNDPNRPIVIGMLREGEGWPFEDRPGLVEVDADGERMVVSAKTQLVLRCGKASITLTKAGKVLIKGDYVLSYSSGMNRLKGGSVQIN